MSHIPQGVVDSNFWRKSHQNFVKSNCVRHQQAVTDLELKVMVFCNNRLKNQALIFIGVDIEWGGNNDIKLYTRHNQITQRNVSGKSGRLKLKK